MLFCFIVVCGCGQGRGLQIRYWVSFLVRGCGSWSWIVLSGRSAFLVSAIVEGNRPCFPGLLLLPVPCPYWAGLRVCFVGDKREWIGWNPSSKQPGRKGWASPRAPGAPHILDAWVPRQCEYIPKWVSAGATPDSSEGGLSQQHLGQSLTVGLELGSQVVYLR